MDQQAQFEKAVDGLMKQGFIQSMDTMGESCAYGHFGGMLRCAVGHLLGDLKIPRRLQDSGINSLLEDQYMGDLVMAHLEIDDTAGDKQFLDKLQLAHDEGHTPKQMITKLVGFANVHNLVIPSPLLTLHNSND